MSDRQERIPVNEHAQAAQARRRPPPAVPSTEPGFVTHDPLPAPGPLAADGTPRRRKQANPFGAQHQRLAFAPREGYHRHWFNDENDRIQRADDGGYTHVHQNGKPVAKVVGVSRGGGALTAFLMEIPIEWYNEDMAAQEGSVWDLLQEIRDGNFERPRGGDGRLRYAGSSQHGDISIRMGNRR